MSPKLLGTALRLVYCAFFVLDRKYAVSGAQPIEMFNQAIEQAYKEANPFQTIGSDDEYVDQGWLCNLIVKLKVKLK